MEQAARRAGASVRRRSTASPAPATVSVPRCPTAGPGTAAPSPEHGEDKVAHKLLTQVVNVNLLDARCLGLLACRLQLLPLQDVCHTWPGRGWRTAER